MQVVWISVTTYVCGVKGNEVISIAVKLGQATVGFCLRIDISVI